MAGLQADNSKEDGKAELAGRIYVKIHDTPEGSIIAMCDVELIGSKHSEGKSELDLESYAGFYIGDLMKPEDAGALVGEIDFYTANIVGEASVGIFIERKMAEASDIRKIGRVPCLHLFKMDFRSASL
jgi:hypothetical protein